MEFTIKEKEILVDLLRIDIETTYVNYSDKSWINEFINVREKIKDKIEEI